MLSETTIALMMVVAVVFAFLGLALAFLGMYLLIKDANQEEEYSLVFESREELEECLEKLKKTTNTK